MKSDAENEFGTFIQYGIYFVTISETDLIK
jgi:hypothetical protein